MRGEPSRVASVRCCRSETRRAGTGARRYADPAAHLLTGGASITGSFGWPRADPTGSFAEGSGHRVRDTRRNAVRSPLWLCGS